MDVLGKDRIKAENKKLRPILENMLKKKIEPVTQEEPKTNATSLLVASNEG
jgi:hypothetical protein